MFSNIKYLLFLSILFSLFSCSVARKLEGVATGVERVDLALPVKEVVSVEGRSEASVTQVEDNGEPFIMKALKDSRSGEMVATDVISASRVYARFRNVAERFGKVSLEFDVIVPSEMMDSRWRLKFFPILEICGDSLTLDPIFITGEDYRSGQLRGYRRYEAFLASILTDSTDFIRLGQLEYFIQRNFPDIYAMKRDSSFVCQDHASKVFGVSEKQAIEHYTMRWLVARNKRRMGRRQEMYNKYIKDPLDQGSIRLDTLIDNGVGDIIYRYKYMAKSCPGLRKIVLSLESSLYEDGELIVSLPRPEDVVFYVSSLSTLVDKTVRYKKEVIDRVVYDNTYAFIDFEAASSVVDSTLSDNARELARIDKVVSSLGSMQDYALDSIRVTSSCSPEGAYVYNEKLAEARSEAVVDWLGKGLDPLVGLASRSVPENWDGLCRLVAADTVLSLAFKDKVLAGHTADDLDMVEKELSGWADYRHLRERVYPRLRTVNFEFFLHKRGVVKDTIHTTVVDSVYMEGVEALIELDYKRAVTLLLNYEDYNAALACLAAGYEETAQAILSRLEASSLSDYLLAIISARRGENALALEYFKKAVNKEPALVHRANLDPELADIIQLLTN